MPPSPRIRADFLLLFDCPTRWECLQAFATESGTEFCRPYANILKRAASELPELPALMDALTVDLVAFRATQFLEGGRQPLTTDASLPICDLLAN